MTTGFCCKCKKKVEMINSKEVKTKKGLKMLKGKCKTCGTTVCKILGK